MVGRDREASHAINASKNPDAHLTRRFDAVIVGGGAAGGLAAEELTNHGLNVLLLDAGRRVRLHEAPFTRVTQDLVRFVANPKSLPFISSAMLYKGRKALRIAGRRRQPIQTACYAWERMPEAFVDDLDSPYSTGENQPFVWLRARTLGGRLVIPGHGRQYLRFGPADFAPSDGHSPIWPFTGSDLDPWYAKVERRLGLYGAEDGIPWAPDSEILHKISPSTAESRLISAIRTRWPTARPIMGRFAPPPDTIATAAKTGRLTIREGSIARAIDVAGGRAKGVYFVDSATGKDCHVECSVVFLCASALESTRILLLTRDFRTGGSLATASGMLGRNLMDHVMIKAEGVGPALPVADRGDPEDGRCVYLPRFDGRSVVTPSQPRGFGVQLYQSAIAGPQSFFTAVSFSEMLPRPGNLVEIDYRRTDRWNIPILNISCRYGENEKALAAEQTRALQELADVGSVRLSRLDIVPPAPGSAVHECGTARMGTDQINSVLSPYNECWDAKGLYVTDSSSFPSQGSQNPTLTVMALTARACSHVVGQLRPSK